METVSLNRIDGTSISATLICYFENISDKKQYIYYTLNEISGTDTNSTVKIYCVKVRQNDPALDTAISESTWEQLKGHMAEALKGILNPDIKFLPISQLVDKTIVSEKVIAMPVSYNYVDKHYQFYLANVSNDTTGGDEIAPIANNEIPLAPQETVSEPAPVSEPVVLDAPQQEPEPIVAETLKPIQEESTNNNNTNSSEPIDITSIEEKYAKMIEDITKLKELELEAAKRYNATLQLSTMHNEQHASYVQSEQIKENGSIASVPAFEPAPVEPAPINPVPPVSNVMEPISQPQPAPNPTPTQDLETNWFDMPIQ